MPPKLVSALFDSMTPSEQRPRVGIFLLAADLWLLVIMLCTFFAPLSPAIQLLNQGLAFLFVATYLYCHVSYGLRVAPEFWLIGLFLLWCFVSGAMVAVSVEEWSHRLIMISRFCAVALAISGFAMAKRNVTNNFIIALILGVYLTTLFRLSGTYYAVMSEGASRRQAWGNVNSNTVGMLILQGFMGLIYLWGTTRNLAIRLGLVMLAIPMAFMILSTASRKSFSGLLFLALAWLFFCYRKELLRSASRLIFVVVVLAALYGLTYFMLTGSLMRERFELAEEQGGLGEGRTSLYLEAWEFFKELPFTGVGLGNFAVRSERGLETHSEYMEILSTTGLVGAALYFPVYPILWRRISRLRRTATDPRINYQLGTFKAMILTLLMVGIGAPVFETLYSWFFLGTMIGYTYSLSRTERVAPRKAYIPSVWRGRPGIVRQRFPNPRGGGGRGDA